MEGSWQIACAHFAAASLRIKEQETLEKLDTSGATDAAVKVFQVRAASKSHMLAIVHVLAVGQPIRRRPAAEEWPLFE